MAGKQRKNDTAREKVQILRRHLLDKVAFSDLCDEYHLHLTVFCRLQKQFFEKGITAFERETTCEQLADKRRIASLQEKLQKKNGVPSELMEEHVEQKKELGES